MAATGPTAPIATGVEAAQQYAQFHPHSSDYKLDALSIADVTPRSFFDNYVALRKPCIIRGLVEPFDDESRWTDERMVAAADDATIQVERRENATHGTFGHGNKVYMTFRQFINKLRAGDSSLYLSAQPLLPEEHKNESEDQNGNGAGDGPGDDDGRQWPFMTEEEDVTSVVPWHVAPVSQLLENTGRNRDAPPPRPSFMDMLVLQQVNMWMGVVPTNGAGSTTGLHHDVHDNVYVLLRGRKRFALFSPRDSARLYARGRVERVAPNGRILCVDPSLPPAASCDVNDDGSLHSDVVRAQLERELHDAEAYLRSCLQVHPCNSEESNEGCKHGVGAFDNPGINESETVLKARQLYEDVSNRFETFLEQECLRAAGFDPNCIDDDDQCQGLAQHDEEGGETESESGAAAAGCGSVKGGTAADDGGAKEGPANKAGQAEEGPWNFSQIPADMTEQERIQKFPLYAETTRIDCELSAGEMLYLPASWWHEVTSLAYVSGDGRPEILAARHAPGSHLAFNYWFHPPTTSNYEKPYENAFWPNQWAARLARVKADAVQPPAKRQKR